GAEHDGVGDRDDAAFGLRERQPVERTHHARHHAAVRHVRAAVADVRDRAVAADDEPDGDAPRQVGVIAQAVLVAEAEAAEVLPDDALDALRREPAAHLRGAHADLRGLRTVRAAEPAVARTKTLSGAGAGAVAQGADAAEADTLAAAAAALADAGE